MDSEDDYRPGSDTDKQEEIPSSTGEEQTTAREKKAFKHKRTRRNAPPTAPSLKRQKGPFNAHYLALLNEDIQDAATGLIHHEADDQRLPPLEHTQLGAVAWNPREKEAFFTALGRLGRDDLKGIAARVRTKSELEVHQYIALLDAFDRHRRADDGKRQRSVRPVDIPAAVEVSPECSNALEEAADSLALRREAHEVALEQKRWHARWLVTPPVAEALDEQFRTGQWQGQRQGGQSQELSLPPFAELFPVRNWLRLADRVFLNSTVPDGNWRSVSEEGPAVRATAFADFHALAVNITKRLFLATVYVANSRIRAKNAGEPRRSARPLVKVQDVRAAVASVGLKDDSREFWARCARRIRLDVYDGSAWGELSEGVSGTDADEAVTTGNEDDDDQQQSQQYNSEATDTEEDDYDILSYNDVETALGVRSEGPQTEPNPEKNIYSTSDESEPSDTEPEPEPEPNPPPSPNHSDTDIDMNAPNPTNDPDLDASHAAAIEQDLDEALTFSAMDYTGTARAKAALRARVRAEHRLELDAERLDAQAGAQEEMNLWAVLRREEAKPPVLKVEGDVKGSKTGLLRTAGVGETGANWRDGVRYRGEWEVAGTLGR
ncbi:Uu.00g018830.m01.CDS01 [Anthostomella pinea]|uniref:Uu.00g018830.m01.CDS01 n=1 Tax=Anthostomella pinea TaxID=933095 RepID=A0AAI8VZ58_9PEZI|nr:Uu.00g018830.m01.CDS01 [Anthostomella pinea]